MRRRLSQSKTGWSNALVVSVGVIALFVLVTITTRMQGIPVFTPPEFIFPAVTLPEQPASTPSAAPLTPAPTPQTPVLSAIVNVIAIVLGVALLVLLVFFIVRALRALWRDRRLRLRKGSALGADVVDVGVSEEVIDAPIVRRGISGALATLNESTAPSEAIIAAWIGLEETAREVGITRAVTETPAEFTMRLIVRTEEVREPADTLLNVYEQVRFGGKTATEHDRAIARGALQKIEEGWR